MRFLEAVLIVGNLATFLLLVVPRIRATRWPLFASVATVVISAAQIFFEGARWQMVPAYVLSGLFLLASVLLFLLRPVQHERLEGSLGRRAAIGVVAGLAVFALAISSALPAIMPIFHFATPRGPYAIGTLTYDWVDPSRADLGNKSARREIMVQIWYPAEKSSGPADAPYLQPGIRFAALAHTMHLPAFFFDQLTYIRTHAIQSAPVVKGNDRFPILIFSPGILGYRQHNTFEVEQLVSQGYIVAAIDHPWIASEVMFSDGRRIDFDPHLIDIPNVVKNEKYAEALLDYVRKDVSFALDKITALNAADPNHILTGRLDMNRAGMIGMSFGGLITSEACRADMRLKACIVQDVFVPQDAVKAGIQQPTMWLTRNGDAMKAEGWPKWEVDEHQNSVREVFEGAKHDAYLVQIPGMFHVNYTDYPYVIAAPVARAVGLIGAADWRRGHDVINAYTLAFFDRYLRGNRQEPLLNGPSRQYPEVHIESRRH